MPKSLLLRSPRLLLRPAALAAAALAAPVVLAQAPGLAKPPPLPSAVAVRPAPNLEIRYRLLEAPGSAGPGRLEGIVSGRQWELRSSMLVVPGAELTPRTLRLDSGLQLEGMGPLRTVVVGDTLASGGAWSRPVRLGGLRLGRPLALPPGFDATPLARVGNAGALPRAGLGFAGPSAQGGLLGTPRLHPPAPAPRLPATSGPRPLGAGHYDYEIELGRLRTGWGTDQDRYGEGYAAAAFRRGFGHGFTGEWRSEWTRLRQATGLELVHGFGSAALVHAVVAHSAALGESGLRWGLGTVRQALDATWRLSWDAFEQDYTPVAFHEGEADPRARLEAAVNAQLARHWHAGLSYARESAWNAPAAQVFGLTTQLRLAGGRSLAINLTDRLGDQAGRQARIVYTLPLWGPVPRGR
ncbi:hypothetical protein [Ramlibacter rhizophilus]|uniref:hypothetical protein n=1 Tax=Ramlibacter rhizophilus TaxID=1781167 RepID=UPI001F0F93BA|nr:hypothetical protein [Ramlibacter rhizophilus]